MLNVTKVDVWATTLQDRPDALTEKLEGLAKAGADLEFVISHRVHEEPGTSVLLVTPLCGERQTAAALAAGFRKSDRMHCLRMQGADEPGMAYMIMRALASEHLAVRGMSAATVGHELLLFLAFDSGASAEQAMARLQRPL